MKINAISHSDDIASLVWGAFRHPDAKVRASLRSTHDEWLESCEPNYSRDEVRDVFLKAKGTFLEPYSFPMEVMEEAISLTQAGFSKAYGAQRVYIANTDESLPTKGILLTAGLSHKCVERYALGKFRKPSRTAWSLNPMLLPSTTGKVPGYQRSPRLLCGEHGFEINFRWPGKATMSHEFTQQLAVNSRFQGVGRTIHDQGLSLIPDYKYGRIIIRTQSPETMIRFMGLLEEKEELHLTAGDCSEFSVNLTLHPIAEGHSYSRLPSRIYTNGAGLPWIRVMPSKDEGIIPRIKPKDKAELAKLFPCPLQWKDEIHPILNAS